MTKRKLVRRTLNKKQSLRAFEARMHSIPIDKFRADLEGRYLSSFDCYDPNENERVQVKAASSNNELSSFGPNSVFDELYFLDFFNQGQYNGTFEIYKLGYNSTTIRQIQISSRETFGDVADGGKRPRFSIRKLINENNLNPIINGNLF